MSTSGLLPFRYNRSNFVQAQFPLLNPKLDHLQDAGIAATLASSFESFYLSLDFRYVLSQEHAGKCTLPHTSEQ